MKNNSVQNLELLKYFQETLEADFRLNRAIYQDLKEDIKCALNGTIQPFLAISTTICFEATLRIKS